MVNLKNLKIGTLLSLGFTAMLLFVIVLAVVSYYQSGLIQLQTEIMYSHPVKVRRTIGKLDADILSMRLGLRDLMLAKDNREKKDAMLLMEFSAADAYEQFKILDDQYLGPKTDIDEALKAFINWKIAREENIRLVRAGEVMKVKESILDAGTIGIARGQMMAKIRKIDELAQQKSEALFVSSVELKEILNRELLLLVGAILLLSLLIYNFLLRNILKPIDELTSVAKRFRNGDMNSRSSYNSQNEFGLLSDSFNTMVGDIQVNKVLDEKIVDLAGLMLNEYDARKFFRSTLNALALHTGSQMAVVYLLSDDKKTYEHFESTGIGVNAGKSFDACSFEGEFGAVLSSRKVQHIKNIPGDTRFIFETVSGKFIPREIITIPIIADRDVMAIISLRSISSFSNQSVRLVDSVLVTLCARIEGILTYHKIKEFSEQLRQQNSELEAQKTELASQSAELTNQNMELEMQKKQLTEASRLKTNFLSNMSHELRTPLNSVIALSGVLNRRLVKKISAEEYSYLEVIERNGKNLLSLINDILDISRIEAGREEIEIAQFNIGNLISEVITMINPQAQQKNVELIYTEGDGNLDLESDRKKCRHILQNLIANAVKFTEQGNVKISVLQFDHHVAITVADTGIGISDKHLPHIFDEFRQADGSTSRKFGGTGLGLAIARKYTTLLGGTISVKSIPGTGSIFTITLPLCYAAEKNSYKTEDTTVFSLASEQPADHHASSLNGKTILLAEDSEPAIIRMKNILEESGYQMLVTRNGEEGLEANIARPIDDKLFYKTINAVLYGK